MVKECKVILHNSAVIVVDFDGTHIQFPAAKTNNETVYVEYVNDRYSIVSKNDYEKSLKPKADKKPKKIKTTETDLVEEVVESESVVDETDTISE
jgi:hypothetical protein